MSERLNHPQVEMVPHGSIEPNPRAVKRSNHKSRRQLQASIRRFGIKGAIIVDRDSNMILAGNGLWKAAGDLGLTEVPIIRESFRSEADRRAFVLAYNKLAESSDWDMTVVEEELKFLLDSDYDFEITGFTTNDLDFAFVAKAPEDEAAVELPDPNARAVSRGCDLWYVGPHAIYCGDSLDPVSFELVLRGRLAEMIFSDPPYGVKVNGHISTTGRHREFAMMSGEQTSSELVAFLRKVFRNCVEASRKSSIHFSCIDWRHVREMIDAGEGVYTELKNICVWDKGVGSLGSFYRSRHEFVLVFKSGRGKHINNMGEAGRFRTNVWQYEGQAQFRKGREEDLATHPTCKSVPMIVDAIRDCSNPGDLILDPFGGSGTTAVAAHLAGRHSATIEIDELYVDAILRRLAKVTGEVPLHADGRTFDEVAQARAVEEDGDV